MPSICYKQKFRKSTINRLNKLTKKTEGMVSDDGLEEGTSGGTLPSPSWRVMLNSKFISSLSVK